MASRLRAVWICADLLSYALELHYINKKKRIGSEVQNRLFCASGLFIFCVKKIFSVWLKIRIETAAECSAGEKEETQ